MREASRGLGIVVAAASLAGCGTTIAYVPLNDPPHAVAPRTAGSVQMFTVSPPDHKFVEMGMIESQQQGDSRDGTAEIYAKMRDEAALRGCDGLVITGANNATVVSGSNGSVSSRTLKGFRATCIVYTDPSIAPPVAVPAPVPVGAAPAAPAAPAPAGAVSPARAPHGPAAAVTVAPAPPPVAVYTPPPAAAAVAEGPDRPGFSVAALIGFVVGSNDFSGFAGGARAGYSFPFHLYFGGDLTFYPISGTTIISVAPEIGYDAALTGIPLVIRPYAGLGFADSTGGGSVAFELYPGVEALYSVTRELFIGADVRIPLVFVSSQTVDVPGLGSVSGGGGTLAGFNLMATGGYKF